MHSTTDFTPIPGSDLRRRRMALGAQQKDVAERMGLTRISVYRIERQPEVPVLVARRYLEALSQIAGAA
jgi:transcriptional regulator with XRE-family HTH domain